MFSQKHAKISKFDRKVDLHGYHFDWAGAKTTETSSIQKAKSPVPKDSYFLTEVENFVEAEGRLVLEDKKLSTCENAPMSYHVSKPKKRKMKNWKGIRLGVFLSIFWLFRGVIPPKMCKKGRLVEKLRVQFVQKWGYLSGENLVGPTRSFRIIKIWSWWIGRFRQHVVSFDSSASLKSKTSKLQAEDDLENSKEKSVIEKTKSLEVNDSGLSNFCKSSENRVMITLDIAESGHIFIYLHKIMLNEHTRKTCSSVIIKVFDVENVKIKPVWSKTKTVLDDQKNNWSRIVTLKWTLGKPLVKTAKNITFRE